MKKKKEDNTIVLGEYYTKLYNGIMQDQDIYDINSKLKKKYRLMDFSYASKEKIKKNIELYEDLGIKLRNLDLMDYTTYESRPWKEEKETIKKVHPKDIPIYLFDSPTLCGQFRPTFGELDIVTVKGRNDVPIKAISGIGVEKNTSKVAGSFYNNQIAHAEIDTIDGSVLNFLDKDVVPIFFEQLTAYLRNPEVYILVRNARLLDLAENIKDLHIFNKDSYLKVLDNYKNILSTLKAFNLLDTYLSSNESTKKEIMNYIQSIFNAEITVDSLLSKFEIDIDSSEKSLKTLKKI